MPARGREASLGRGPLHPPQRVCHGQTKVDSEVGRLIEASNPPPAQMQRHGHDAIGIAQHVLTVRPHQRGERRRERPTPLVLERVNDLAKGRLVRAHRSASDDGSWHAATARALQGVTADHPPGGYGIAAGVANRRCDCSNRSPATGADRPT